MKRKAYHAVVPAIMPAIFFLIAATPVETLGCFARGLLAMLVALVSGLAALGTAFVSGRGRSRGDAYAPWWVVSTLILTIPVVALLILA
jgi:ATP/ADP translocase